MPQNATFLSFYLVDNQLFSNSETLDIYSKNKKYKLTFKFYYLQS
jgi:hypothetical protein